MVQKPKTLLEFAQIVNGFTRILEDSHTALNPRDLLRLSRRDRKIAPFHLKEIGGKFYLRKILNDAIPLGVEVLAFDTISVKDLYLLTKTLAPSEGAADSARKELIEIMMGLVFNLFNETPSGPVNITYVNSGDTMTKVVTPIKLSRYLGRNSWYEKDDFDLSPFNAKGGLGKMHQLFGNDMTKLVEDLNEALVA